MTLDRRRAGVLLHPTSLPSGTLGADAFRFADFLAQAGFSVWQVLPLGPTHEDRSPYLCLSVHALNPRLIDPANLVERGWLESAQVSPDDEAATRPNLMAGRTSEASRDTGSARGPRLDPIDDEAWRAQLGSAHAGFRARATQAEREALETFTQSAAHWLEDYALYQVLRDEHGRRPWWEWPPALRDRESQAMEIARAGLAGRIAQVRFEQFVAAQQWQRLRDYARSREVRFFGDMPIFVAHDSAEVWAHREYFKLDETGHPQVVAGVPPDYFSKTGQRWGNPVYDWRRMGESGFRWWIERMETDLARFDLVRVDHFRGFEACWEIPAADETAENGNWVRVPGEALFDALLAEFRSLPLVAEDLGFITAEVHRLREKYGFPGMRVLQFAFDGGSTNPYLPHNHTRQSVVYTGTHDNDTTRAWFEDLTAEKQLYVVDYLGFQHEPMPWPLIRAALASVADLAVIPMQDLLLLGRGHRMNTPGIANDNWRWRFDWAELAPGVTATLQRLARLYGR